MIHPSNSPWSSPVVLVKKLDGSHRFVHYRQLNSRTLDRHLLTSWVRHDTSQGYDQSSGYWQIAMHHKSQEKTAYATHEGLYKFCVMLIGLKNAPALFPRVMQLGLNLAEGDPFVSST